MTCIAGYVDRVKGRVIIGGDSAGLGGLNITIRKDPKVFKVGEFVIGCVHSFRMTQLLRFSFTPPEVGEKDIYEYMCTDFINAVRDCFRDGGYLQTTKDGEEMGGFFLVGYKDRLFEIDADFQVCEPFSGIAALGCGANYAMGALYVWNLNAEKTPETKIQTALYAADYFSAGVCPPFTIIST